MRNRTRMITAAVAATAAVASASTVAAVPSASTYLIASTSQQRRGRCPAPASASRSRRIADGHGGSIEAVPLPRGGVQLRLSLPELTVEPDSGRSTRLNTPESRPVSGRLPSARQWPGAPQPATGVVTRQAGRRCGRSTGRRPACLPLLCVPLAEQVHPGCDEHRGPAAEHREAGPRREVRDGPGRRYHGPDL